MPRRERETAQVVPLRRASAPARAEPDAEAAFHEFLRALLAAIGPDPAPSPPAP